ncbi:esterase-like activity of phytase family protein [Uliginosibacterium sediminicola]|uniref:Esterase-like activity of phytase family protein n=1 Tax=Uliginosibacterium sediminicola TaxID=2024550 RepID=A0ABU9YZ70_9RHOO
MHPLAQALSRPSRLSLILLPWLLASCATTPTPYAPPVFSEGDVVFLGAAAIPGGSRAVADKSGLPHTLLEDGKSYRDAFDGFGSGIAYTGFGQRYLAMEDRGPNKYQYAGGNAFDFTTSYPNRFQIVDIDVAPAGNRWRVEAKLVGTALLKNEAGQNFVGISSAFTQADPNQNLRLDPEGIRVAPDGTVWISDEYGPVVYHFDQRGKRIGKLDLPPAFLLAKPAQTLAEEMKPDNNRSGRYTNRGAEGLAISPDGKTLLVALQSALVQDGGMSSRKTRFLVYDLSQPNKAPRQFIYVCDSTKLAISEVLAINDHQFLVNERDGTPGAKGSKLLYFIDLQQNPAPSDISQIDKLPADGAASELVPLQKTLFADIGKLLNAANPYTTAEGLPDKIEGYAFGPDLPDGRHLLLATNDNDFADSFPNYIFAFAIKPGALPKFQPFKLRQGLSFQP